MVLCTEGSLVSSTVVQAGSNKKPAEARQAIMRVFIIGFNGIAGGLLLSKRTSIIRAKMGGYLSDVVVVVVVFFCSIVGARGVTALRTITLDATILSPSLT